MSNVTAPAVTGVTPYLTVRGASAAAEFYTRAFGAEELGRVPAGDGTRLLHCCLRINEGIVMLSDEFPEQGFGLGDGPAGVTLHLQVNDADAWFTDAVEAGATVRMPLADQFWGDRYGQVTDPFGHVWSIGSPMKA